MVRTDAGGDGIVPALQPLALERCLGPVLANHLDDTTRAGAARLLHANRRVREDRFEQGAIGGAVEDDRGLVGTGELLNQTFEPEVQKEIAMTRFDAAGKALPVRRLRCSRSSRRSSVGRYPGGSAW
jgi:hypothetical protein